MDERGVLPDTANARLATRVTTRWPIQHLIVIVQQRRSFDNIFAGFPKADAPTDGFTSTGKRVPLKAVPFDRATCNIRGVNYFEIAWHHAKMDGWNLLDPEYPRCPYTRVERSQTKPYWNLARTYALADRMFSSTRFFEFPERLYLIAGTSRVSAQTFDIGLTDDSAWGCEAPAGTRSAVVHRGLVGYQGPFPCFKQFRTLANLFDDADITWRAYCEASGAPQSDWNPFSSIQYVFEGSDWKRDMSSPPTNVLSDIAKGHLTAVSFVLSPYDDSDAPGVASGGPRWVDSIVRATKRSRYWSNSAIVLVWDDEGGGQFYDNAAPPQLDAMGLGFRVPMLVVSPYAKPDYVSHTQYEFGSILKFIEQNWKLPYLGGSATDKRANSIADMFDFGR